MTKSIIKLLILGLAFAVPSVAAQGSPITYIDSTIASGSLGNSTFNDALVTLTMVGDTSNVFPLQSQTFINQTGTFTVDIAGLGTATFLDGMEAFVNQAASDAGFYNTQRGFNVFFTYGNQFASYGLTTAIGPITGNTSGNGYAVSTTTAGDFVVRYFGASTFTAVTDVPEPATLALFGAGLLGLGAARRNRKKPQTPIASRT